MEVLLKKDDRDEENADDDYSYVFTEAITCARAGIVWTRRGATWTSGFSRTGIGNLNHLEMI